jgi:disulfide bond formation protein DsbB
MEKAEQIESLTETKAFDAPVYAAWVVALVATVGSLFFSEVMLLPPCVLCWYQRIAMYPLVVILGVGIILGDRRVKFYALPVALAGLVVAGYHNLLYYGILPESIAPCTQGISCTSVQLEWLGFITIPLMSLTAFVLITLSLLFYKSVGKEKLSTDEHR